jgi:RNA polymerase sigma-70 factor (ECF subfamily)
MPNRAAVRADYTNKRAQASPVRDRTFWEPKRRPSVSLPVGIVKLLVRGNRMSSAKLHIANSVDQSQTDFKASLIALIPHLRAFATVMCRDRELAKDLTQETLVKAWRAQGSFEPGSNLRAWLFTILRNEFLTYRRRASRQATWNEDTVASRPVDCGQQWSSELSDIGRALHGLSIGQCEALILTMVGGFSYDEAARICSCSVGTVKSRVFRARAALTAMLDGSASLPPRRSPGEGSGLDQVLAHLPSTLSAHGNPALSPPG